MAVRFDTADVFLKQIPQPYLPLKVNYAKDFPRVSLYDPDRLRFVQNTLGTKAEAWQHEKEWRLIAIGRSGITLTAVVVRFNRTNTAPDTGTLGPLVP